MTFISSSSKESQEFGEGVEPKKKNSVTKIKQVATSAAKGSVGVIGETISAFSSPGGRRGRTSKRDKISGGGRTRGVRSKLAKSPLSLSPLMDFDLDPTRQTSITDIQGGILAPFDMTMDLGINEDVESHTSITNTKGGILSKNDRFRLF